MHKSTQSGTPSKLAMFAINSSKISLVVELGLDFVAVGLNTIPTWEFVADGKRLSVNVNPALSCNTIDVALDAAYPLSALMKKNNIKSPKVSRC
jgi:hypothetical protein